MQPTDQEREPERSSFTDNLRWASPFLRSLGPVLFCALATPAAETQTPVTMAKSINQLKAFYQQNCTRCHGRDGSARGADGKKLGGQDFTLAAQDFQKLRGPASEREIRAMAQTIRKGVFFGLSMPSWKDQLSQEEAALMVKEVLLKAEPGKAIEPESVSTSHL